MSLTAEKAAELTAEAITKASEKPDSIQKYVDAINNAIVAQAEQGWYYVSLKHVDMFRSPKQAEFLVIKEYYQAQGFSFVPLVSGEAADPYWRNFLLRWG